MSNYYLREIMYELQNIADAMDISNGTGHAGKAAEARKKRWEGDEKARQIQMEILSGKFPKPE